MTGIVGLPMPRKNIMKKYLYLFSVALLAVMAVAFTGCGNDDKEQDPGNPDALVGTWKVQNASYDAAGLTGYDQYNADGSWNGILVDSDKRATVVRGRWKINGNTIICSAVGLSTTAVIIKLTSSNLVAMMEGTTEVRLKKVPDSEVAPYLK